MSTTENNELENFVKIEVHSKPDRDGDTVFTLSLHTNVRAGKIVEPYWSGQVFRANLEDKIKDIESKGGTVKLSFIP